MRVIDLDAGAYARHMLHADDRIWLEKNCYVDIWIELIHALGCEPRAILPFVFAIDFEGDQWTFFKPPHDELRDLYGIDVQELNCWRPLLEHAREHLAAGKLISTEADAWWLPDTSGTDYRTQHTKSTIVLNDLDVDARRLGYFHNAGYFTLEGEDFERTFNLDRAPDPAFMPLFAEIVRVDGLRELASDDVAEFSEALLARHVARMPTDNPVERFAARFARDLPALQEQGLAYYHAWAFATVRQLGAASELAALHLQWLDAERHAVAMAAYAQIANGAKVFILKAARAVNAKRAFDAAPLFDEWARAWQSAKSALEAQI
ncbi:MAG: DUF1839 family protein [Rudaea sp.]